MEKRARNNLILVGLAAMVATVLIYITWPFATVIMLTLVLGFILQYPIAWLEQRIHRRQTSVLIVLGLSFAALALVLLDVVYIFHNEVARLAGSSGNVNTLLSQSVGGLIPSISARISASVPATGLQGGIAQVSTTALSALLANVTRVIEPITANIGLYVVELIIMTLLLYLLLLHGNETVRSLKTLVPREYQAYVNQFLRHKRL